MNMEMRLSLLEQTVAQQAILIQALQRQLEGQAISQQKAQFSQPKGERPKAAGDGVATTRRCEYGSNCGKEFCRFEHTGGYCSKCAKHNLQWGSVNFSEISEAAKTIHFKKHNVDSSSCDCYIEESRFDIDSCWQGYYCYKCDYNKHKADGRARGYNCLKFKMICGGSKCPTAVEWAKGVEHAKQMGELIKKRDDWDDDEY